MSVSASVLGLSAVKENGPANAGPFHFSLCPRGTEEPEEPEEPKEPLYSAAPSATAWMWISTRRFCWRPSAVALDVFGFASPNPYTMIELAATP